MPGLQSGGGCQKKVLFRSEARERLLRGVATLTDAVRVTLGPRSKSVLIEKRYGSPIVCNDGVTIAKEMELEDPVENLGAHMIRQAAERTGEAVGDGTSTATILAHAIFADGVRNVVAGASAIDLKRGLDRGARVAIEALRGLSRPMASRKEKAQVATISAHNDPVIGELVAEATERVWAEGVITLEESKGTETQIEVVNEMRKGAGTLGFDSTRREYVDLVAAGIIDPTKVVRVALENAVSVASLLLLTEATLTEVPEEKKEPGMPMHE
ncbi:MAG: TCP-1/cpn60 chaperonin family protein [candidate division NC10 bacterium]